MATSCGARLLLEGSTRRWLGGLPGIVPEVLWREDCLTNSFEAV